MPRLSSSMLIGGSLLVVALAIRNQWVKFRNKYVLLRFRAEMRGIRSTHPEYVYEPLAEPASKTIRLLELLPADDEEKAIRINIRSSSLADPSREHYEAISYCWGDPADPNPIFCSDSIIWVTDNLYSALRRLRQQSQARLLWADAVCINQSDNREKSWQVQMMAEVYRDADRVLIWLGEEAYNSAVLKDFIPLLSHAKILYDSAGENRIYWDIDLMDRKAYTIPSFFSSIRKYVALRELAARPWFHRVWIIQELAMAREATILIDDWSMPWETFERAWNFVHKDLNLLNATAPYDSSTTPASNVFNISSARAQVRENNSDPFVQVLTRHSHALATDPRDKVFSLAGLSPDAKYIEINYEDSTSQVFHKTALEILRSDQNLDILSFAACQPGTAGANIPSWVPDWGTGDVSLSLATTIDSESLFPFQATEGSKRISITTRDGSRLLLPGYEIDSVEIAGDAMPPYRYAPPHWEPWEGMDDVWTLEQWETIFGADSDEIYEATGETAREVYWKSLVFGFGNNDFELKKLMGYKSWITRFLYSLPLPHKSLPIRILAVWMMLLVDVGLIIFGARQSNRVLESCLRFCYGRRMIKTKIGYIGLATRNVEVDDTVFLLKGGNVPYILRKIDQAADEDEYILVGDCYVHGIMYGEAWDLSECRPIWLM